MTQLQESSTSAGLIDRILNAISSVIIYIDHQGHVVQWNEMAHRTFDIDHEQAIGASFLNLDIRWDRDAIRKCMEACHSDDVPQRKEIRFTDSEGRERFFGMTLTAMTDHDGIGFVIVGLDITDKLQAENDLRQAQKLESVGRLASGIAHEINTPIQFVGDNTRFLLDAFADLKKIVDVHDRLRQAVEERKIPAPLLAEAKAIAEEVDVEYLMEEVPRAAEQTLEGVDRVANIVRAMKDFARSDTMEKMPTDINNAITTTLTVASNELKYVADITTDLDPDLPPVLCHEGSMKQVFLNLFVNAAHAIASLQEEGNRQKGTISVTSRQEGASVVIAINDTGTGISKSVQDQIFDPFFTTKEVGKGTGQGLAIARSAICEKHGGDLTFETEEGKGTTFFVRLPVGGPTSGTAE